MVLDDCFLMSDSVMKKMRFQNLGKRSKGFPDYLTSKFHKKNMGLLMRFGKDVGERSKFPKS